MTTNTTNSQAASIDTQEFHELLHDYNWSVGELGKSWSKDELAALIAHINAKLAQAFNDGAIEGRIHQRGVDDARIQAAESRLAEIQRGVEGMTRWTPTNEGDMMPWDDGNFVDRDEVLELFAPQGQAIESKP